ncbi:MAG: HGGxSTG domain-containing protein [Candidatus Sedimenticola sp. (ex Thyasira tokunagai)]
MPQVRLTPDDYKKSKRVARQTVRRMKQTPGQNHWGHCDWESFEKHEYETVLTSLRRIWGAQGRRFVLCGAKTRKGTPCQCKALDGKWRCKLHGGMSTGPKTEAGKQRVREAQRRRWERHYQSLTH